MTLIDETVPIVFFPYGFMTFHVYTPYRSRGEMRWTAVISCGSGLDDRVARPMARCGDGRDALRRSSCVGFRDDLHFFK